MVSQPCSASSRFLRHPAVRSTHISSLMRLFKTKSSPKGSGKTVLERRTAELKEKIAKISFRRHSAPAEQSSRKESEYEPDYYGGGLIVPAASPPLVLCQLPLPILELVLNKISLQELVSGAALVHTTWRAMILDESFWRRRLAGKLPQELVSCFNRGGVQWTKHAAEFFSNNLLYNPDFDPHRLSVAKGLGKGIGGGGGWRVPVGCWQTEALGSDATVARLAFSSSCSPHLRVLELSSPIWATPEAAQEVNLLQRLMDQGMSSAVAMAYLDTCPAISFSVWCRSGANGATMPRGYAVCALDNGRDAGVGWLSLREGSRLAIDKSLAHWISWAPDESLLRGCAMRRRKTVQTERGEFRCLACVFRGYRKGVRRIHIILKGSSQSVTVGGSKEAKAKEAKPYTEFMAPCLRFAMPEV